jgi:hypothetical protein
MVLFFFMLLPFSLNVLFLNLFNTLQIMSILIFIRYTVVHSKISVKIPGKHAEKIQFERQFL